MKKTFGRSSSVVYFRNILPQTYKDKANGYYKFGYNDQLPLDLINIINNSGTAKKACKKYSDYIQADGFVNDIASNYRVNGKETADKILGKIALSFGYFAGVALHVSRLGNGAVGKITVMPFHKVRRGINGDFYFNNTIGTEKYEKDKWVTLQPFKGTIANYTDIIDNKENYGGRGEILYVYDGNPFDSDIYPIPDYVASLEDLKTSSELSKMDYEAVLNGFALGGIMTFIGVDETAQDEDGLTDRQKVESAMMQFTGLKKNKDGLTDRFGVMTNFVATPEQVPTFTGNDPKPILEASNTKRDIIERTVCKLFGVHPVLLGFSEASVLGNDKAIAQASDMLRITVNPIQRLITETFEMLYGTSIDWTISEFGVEINIPTEGDRILKTLNSLSPLLATKVIDLIPPEKLLNALGIESPQQTTTAP